ncbi:MAG: hypothetical protein ACE14P_15100 [Methanotrichaceae archaeon]
MVAPNQSENAVRIDADSATSNTLSELSTALSELQPLASRITDLKKETLEKETIVLKAILEKVTPLMPLLSEDCEELYRHEIVILAREEKVQLEAGLGFFSEYRLILYENGVLVRTHRYGESSEGLRPGWENTDDVVLTPEAAIIAFGFREISKGLIKALGETSSIAILKEKLEGRLASLAQALEVLQYESSVPISRNAGSDCIR